MISRRTLIACLATVVVFATAPTSVDAAGHGRGNGNSGSKGNSGNSGNGGGTGNKGNNGHGPSKGGGVGPNSPGKGQNKTRDEPPDATSGTVDRNAVYRVRHGNGFQESLSKGRYVLQDNRGRTVVNRAAKSKDYARLRKLSRPDS